MTAIYFQLSIILSVFLTSYISWKISFFIAILWAIETFSLLTIGSPLFNTQMIVIWVTFYFAFSYSRKREQIKLLTKISEEYDDRTKLDIEKFAKKSKLETLNGKEHYKYLVDSLDNIDEKVFILSGWISGYVIDDKLIDKFRKLLKRGVKIYIGYGYESKGKHLNNEQTERALTNLRNLYREKLQYKYEGDLIVAKFPNHQKIFLVDNYVTVVGSTNWLSNKGFKNEEYSIAVNSKEFAESESIRLAILFKKYNPKYK